MLAEEIGWTAAAVVGMLGAPNQQRNRCRMDDEDEHKTARLTIYLTPAQKRRIVAKAKRRGILATSKLRELALDWVGDDEVAA
jgi:hypothetical protein